MTLKTYRKIKSQKKGEYSVTKVIRKEIRLQVEVKNVDFSADENGVSLYVKCVNIKENSYVSLGQMQNITIDLLKPIMIYKERWTGPAFQLVNDSVNESKKFDSLILLCKDGYCGFYIMKNSLTILSSKLVKSLPKKRNNLMEIIKKKCGEFYKQVFDHLVSKFNISSLKLIVIAGPGQMKFKLHTLLKNANILVASSNPEESGKMEQFSKKGRKNKRKKYNKNITQTHIKPKKHVIQSHKLLIVNTSSVLKSALDEVLKDKKVVYQLRDTKAFRETQALEEFYKMFSANANKAVYGKKEVDFAISKGAIGKFMICDSLLRCKDFTKRAEYSAMYNKSLRQCGKDNLLVLSENHYSGQKLKEITGVAAILKFEIDLDSLYKNPEEDSSEDSESDSESEEEANFGFLKEVDAKSETEVHRDDVLPKKEIKIDLDEMRKHFDQFADKDYEPENEDFM